MALTDSLVSVWKLEGDGSDSHGSNNLNTSGSPQYVAGKDGLCISFPSSNSGNHLYRTPVSLPQNSSDYGFTISFWYRWKTTTPSKSYIVPVHLMSLNFGSKKTFFKIGTSAYDFKAYNQHATIAGILIYYTIDTNWHFVVFRSYNAPHLKVNLVVDNTLTNTASNSSAVWETNGFDRIFIGATDYDNEAVDSEIDEVCYWSRVLSDQEIADLYNNGDGLFYNPSTSTFGSLAGGIIRSRRLITMI